jgi:hypothetical protein
VEHTSPTTADGGIALSVSTVANSTAVPPTPRFEGVDESPTTVTLAACETVIERGLATFIEVGQALLRIRDEKLYRETNKSFEAYCQERWDFERAHAYRLIEAGEVCLQIGDIATGYLPSSESIARELARLKGDPEAMRKAWKQVLEDFVWDEDEDGNPRQPPHAGERITAAAVRETVRAILYPPPTPEEAAKREARSRDYERNVAENARLYDEHKRGDHRIQRPGCPSCVLEGTGNGTANYDRTIDEATHPDTAAGKAARKAEGLIAKALSTDSSAERHACIDKAHELIRRYGLTHELMVMA